MPQDEEKHENVVSLAEARRRQRTVHRAGANGRPGPGKGDGSSGTTGGWRKIAAYVQFIVFLAVVAYMMQLCRSN